MNNLIYKEFNLNNIDDCIENLLPILFVEYAKRCEYCKIFDTNGEWHLVSTMKNEHLQALIKYLVNAKKLESEVK